MVQEVLCEGPVEIGISADGTRCLELEHAPLPSEAHATPIQPSDIIVITGGARGITAEIAVALAERYQPTLLLLGRSSEPIQEPEWLVGLETEAQIKRGIARHDSEAMQPKQINNRYRQITANRQILRTLRHIEATGASAIYRSADIRHQAELRPHWGGRNQRPAAIALSFHNQMVQGA